MIDDIDSTKVGRDEINGLLDDLEASGWVVLNYNPLVDPYAPLRVEVKLERQGEFPG